MAYSLECRGCILEAGDKYRVITQWGERLKLHPNPRPLQGCQGGEIARK
jgi:hypothetical protein